MKIFDSVFIQPTYSCALNCPGCYVKASMSETRRQVHQTVLVDFLEWLWSSHDIHTRQVTLSVDNLPKEPLQQDWWIMVRALDKCIELREKYVGRTQLHLTVHDIPAFKEYLGPVKRLYGDPQVDLVSLSKIHGTHAEECWIRVAKEHGKRINWNYAVPTNIYNGPNGVYANVNHFIQVLKWVDSAYLILHKPPLGKSYDVKVLNAYKRFLSYMDGNLPPEEKAKIIVDGCVRDSYNFVSKGYGCGVNTRRIHLWPDGHVSGCPYNTSGGRSAHTLQKIIENVYAATEEYEFTSCQLPSDYYYRVPRNQSPDKHPKLHTISGAST